LAIALVLTSGYIEFLSLLLYIYLTENLNKKLDRKLDRKKSPAKLGRLCSTKEVKELNYIQSSTNKSMYIIGRKEYRGDTPFREN